MSWQGGKARESPTEKLVAKWEAGESPLEQVTAAPILRQPHGSEELGASHFTVVVLSS